MLGEQDVVGRALPMVRHLECAKSSKNQVANEVEKTQEGG
jgi:hypothetical protein